MKYILKNNRLLIWLSAILITGFLSTSIGSYYVSKQTILKGIAAQELPLTGDNIYSEVQKDILRPVFISSLMASDTFLRDWVLRGEKNLDEMRRYLRTIKSTYGTVTAFYVSEATGNYYYPDGILKRVKPTETRDAWYYRVRSMTTPYETNVDPDLANRDAMTIFINYRVLDYAGRFIGATGVGLTFDAVNARIENYEQRFQRRIYFIDQKGAIVLAGSSLKHLRGNIRQIRGQEKLIAQMLNSNSTPIQLEYRNEDDHVLINSRFIPELGWYLVVEQDGHKAIQAVRKVFLVNILVSALVTLLILSIILVVVRRHQIRIEKMATTDQLTGLLNRQGLEVLFQQMLKDVERYGGALSAVVLDLDNFKQVNDRSGHLAGDRVIQHTGKLLLEGVRESDIVTRWGGEEFLVLLKNADLEQSFVVAEKIRTGIMNSPIVQSAAKSQVTVSCGVTQYRIGESGDSFLGRADSALYKAKELGRNRTERAY